MFWWKNPKRSKFGKWLDNEGVTQVEFAEDSKVSIRTIWKLCNDKTYIPSAAVLKKVMNNARKIDRSIRSNDFFDI
ncbi:MULTISPECIES: helix-turn-helix domain-containing protein [Priestia]|uniref:helix-turn-helix domain-containing protein n=1 Tax=Priestia TaxID=2800373 RepID=UPI001C8DB956|nr:MULTISPECIES: helix-turn-helix domain-containing protein [Priestia]MBY0214771.1 helix-turn-helix transcriptional regulator [Priestia aryabhattai]MDW4511848.1 helix-turn-helix domain-containing protein [Priestia megaterium]